MGESHTDNVRLTRRGSLVKAGGLLAALLTGGAWAAAEASDEASGAESNGAGPAGVASGGVTCVLTPEQTEGPYYVANERVRRNITEGKPGTPLTLRLRVVNASTCRPIRGAAVDIWHCDAGGVYSDVSQQGTDERTFLRGIQRTNAKGIALFQTVYPGWYPGRTVHVHVKVHLGGTVVHTGQLYLPDAKTDAVYRRAPYSRRPNRDTRNEADSVFRNGGRRSLLSVRRTRTGRYVAAITMGVHRS